MSLMVFFFLRIIFLVIVISVLQQISVDYLEQAMTIAEISDDIQGYIYQQRAQYLEQKSESHDMNT
jgi:uncharacterized protein YoxC